MEYYKLWLCSSLSSPYPVCMSADYLEWLGGLFEKPRAAQDNVNGITKTLSYQLCRIHTHAQKTLNKSNMYIYILYIYMCVCVCLRAYVYALVYICVLKGEKNNIKTTTHTCTNRLNEITERRIFSCGLMLVVVFLLHLCCLCYRYTYNAIYIIYYIGTFF